MKLVEDRVAIAPIENPDKIGHIIIPDQAKDRLNQGFVKYRGPKVKEVKIGDYVFFSGYTGTLTYIEGEGKFIIMPEKFIIATMVWPFKGTDIPGLYFRDKFNRQANISTLINVLAEILPALDTQSLITIAEKLTQRGVASQLDNPFFTASYEMTMNYIAMAFSENQEWRDAIKVMNRHPSEDLSENKAGE